MIFIARNREQLGQFTEDEIREGLRTGKFLGTDLAWRDGMTEWQPLFTLGLHALEIPPLPTQENDSPETATRSAEIQPVWEQPGQRNGFASWFQTTLDLLFSPIKTFSRLPASQEMRRPLLYIILSAAISSPILALTQTVLKYFPVTFLQQSDLPVPSLKAMLLSLPGLMIFIVIGAVVGVYLGGIVLHLCLRIVGGAKGGFRATLRVLAYAGGATYALNAIPFLGWVVSGIWGIILYIIGFKEVHRTDYWRVIVALLIPVFFAILLAIAIPVTALLIQKGAL